jgi:hypothetical protein
MEGTVLSGNPREIAFVKDPANGWASVAPALLPVYFLKKDILGAGKPQI